MYGQESTATTLCHTRDSGRKSRESRHAAQIESEREMGVDPRCPDREATGHVAHVVEARNPAALRGRCVHGARFIGAATGVDHVVRAAGYSPLIPIVIKVDVQRSMNTNRGV